MRPGILVILFLCISLNSFSQVWPKKISLSIDFSEAESALSLMQNIRQNRQVSDSGWQAIFNTTSYKDLREREASFGSTLSDDDFKQFILSNETIAQTDSLASTLAGWKKVNIAAIGKRAFNYLPEDATIKAKVYIMLKPRKNSFVWVKGGQSLLFLYLNPRLSRQQFENKAIHELHHVGMNSLERKLDSTISRLPLNQQNAIRWLGGFGEGEAMLAAAGSPRVHPHHYDDSAAIHEWDSNIKTFNRDLDSLLAFYQKILGGRLTNDADIEAAAGEFYGAQGPFYTVGYKMASLVELTFGRDILVHSYADPRKLLIMYNKAVIKRKLQITYHLWPESFLHALEGQ